jgi:hypothetical protein
VRPLRVRDRSARRPRRTRAPRAPARRPRETAAHRETHVLQVPQQVAGRLAVVCFGRRTVSPTRTTSPRLAVPPGSGVSSRRPWLTEGVTKSSPAGVAVAAPRRPAAALRRAIGA